MLLAAMKVPDAIVASASCRSVPSLKINISGRQHSRMLCQQHVCTRKGGVPPARLVALAFKMLHSTAGCYS